jgi:hypothetical protein
MGSEVLGQQRNDVAGREGERYGGVRFAEVYDIPQLLIWGEEFHKKSPWAFIDYRAVDFAKSLKAAIESPLFIVLIDDDGFLLGQVSATLFNQSEVFAQESLWFSKRSGRALLDKFTEWAIGMGASTLLMGHPCYADQRKAEALTRLFERKGFTPIEKHFVKVL